MRAKITRTGGNDKYFLSKYCAVRYVYLYFVGADGLSGCVRPLFFISGEILWSQGLENFCFAGCLFRMEAYLWMKILKYKTDVDQEVYFFGEIGIVEAS